MFTPLELHESDQKIIFSDDTFRLFQDLMRQKAGIILDDKGKEFVRSRLRDSVIKKEFSDFKDFYYYLKYDKNRETELFNVVDLLTIHETYFFRETLQLEAFSDEVISEIMARNKSHKSIRIWSAGCSTGEEAYTLSMLILEKPELRDWRCEIFGTDISPPVLHCARKGIYTQNSFRGMPDQFLEKYFTKEDKGYQIKAPVKEKVVFFHINLIEPEKMFFLNEMDVIFCRNVIIYFNLDVKKKVIGTFHEKLKQNGFLFLGHSESLSYITADFELRHFKKDMVYQKQSGSRS
ncbi:MAG: protein-glutamate O-methyltransferase CheR [Nitrospirae bacterium]|nr:protein-glutamate O-methyltransferase CheR [Nitrospirota bacterium]MBI3350950.1 protein-glutamate O-methyltransferase CheR [Nitrospirota bacterium]